MSAKKYNIVRKPKKTDEFMYAEEVDDDDDDKSSNSDAKKKMFRFMGIFVFVIIIGLLILYLISLMGGKHSYEYSDIEEVMKKAAIAYFEDYPEYLPKESGTIVEVDSSNLVAAGKMKALNEYTKEGVLCTGKVLVEKSGAEYLYTPYLNCGDTYATIELYKKVLSNDPVVTTGYGLYSNNGAYVYRGEDVDNYVQLDNSVWRIVKITSNNELMMISDTGTPYAQPWDDRYNEERFYESGINQYSASRVKEYLEKIYENPSHDDGEDLLSTVDKTRVLPFTVCSAKRTVSSETKNNSEECTEVLRDQMMGLLTLSEYMYASIDPNCKSSETKSCKNYNYLTKDFDWWLVTANKDDSSTVFKVDNNGIAVTDNASTYSIVRPVILLNSKVLFNGGEGTKEDPYKVR